MSSQAARSGDRQTIFITGAASGMGRATARLFSEKGWFVGGYDVNEDGLKTLEQELGAESCVVRRLDVTDKADFDAAVAEFGEQTGGRLDLLYNNAGIGHAGFFEDVPYEATLQVIQVNFIGVVNGIYAALPLLKQTPNSLCFTTSSSSAPFGMPQIAIYSATKFAVKGLTESLSLEFGRLGVRAADVLPATIDTPILTNTPIHGPDSSATSRSQEGPRSSEGTFRLMPAEAVAETVWQAYNSNRIHWYVPEELEVIDRARGNGAEAARDELFKQLLATRPAQES
jgi:NAD(P)-dependent dehydrogenase (short-subunit alcohol dehydrogenase family)